MCILVRISHFQDSEETIHSAEIKATTIWKATVIFDEQKKKNFLKRPITKNKNKKQETKQKKTEQKNVIFQPILNIFSQKFQQLVLG